MRSASCVCATRDHRLTTLTSRDLGDPILEAPSKLERGLSGDVYGVSPSASASSGSRVEPRGHIAQSTTSDSDRRALTA